MFDSQLCSLVTITFLVQILGLIAVICYRMRPLDATFNQSGILLCILVMGLAALVSMSIDLWAGISQGVTLVLVAVFATCQSDHKEHSPF